MPDADPPDASTAPPRRRLSRDARRRQLLDVAWRLIREEGTEALSLGHVAARAGVTKPVVYDHFGTRSGLLAGLYREYDARQNRLLEAALETSEPTLESTARVIATSYVDCVLGQGREIPGVVAALAGSPELASIRREYETAFAERCRRVLLPFAAARTIPAAGLVAVLGAADALSAAAVVGDLPAHQAREELARAIVRTVADTG